jgi:hypothetical protein
MLREYDTAKADDIAVKAMKDEGLDPGAEQRIRTDFTRRILVTLHGLRNSDGIDRIG